MRIEVDQNSCVGSGNCLMVSEALFDQDEAGVVVAFSGDVPKDDMSSAREAVRLCPAGALSLKE